MGLRENLLEDLKDAMRAKDKVRLETLRFFNAQIKKFEIDSRPKEITEEDVISILKKQVKQRKDSIAQFKEAQRDDLVQNEQAQMDILETYLPEQMSDDQVKTVIESVLKETGATSMKDMGKVMKPILDKLAGKADNGLVSKLVRSMLS